MADPFGEKSHEATPYRREQARRQGQVPKSTDLVSAALLVGALSTLLYFGESLVDFFSEVTRRQLGGQAWMEIDAATAVAVWHGVVVGLARATLPLFGLLFLIAVCANLFQVGFLFLPQQLAFDINRINPMNGLARLFSLSNAVRLGFGIFKIVIVIGVALASLWVQREQIVASAHYGVLDLSMFVVEITLWTCLKIGLALLILALFDFGFQRWKHDQDLRMTDQEVREEMRQLQGDPQIIARRRAVQRQLVLNRLSTIVPTADVVVTNPMELAIAIKYDPEKMTAPIVVAVGAGILAERIRRLALENGIPVVERKELARALHKDVDVNQPIPAPHYAAVAEVLRYVYDLKGKTPAALRSAA